MKKLLKKGMAGLLVLSMLMMTACVMTPAQPQSENVNSSETNTGMANPWEEVSLDEISQALEAQIDLPEGADYKTSLHLTTDDLYEIQFYYDGLDYVYRLKETASLEDISGMYYEWTASSDTMVGEFSGKDYRYISDEETVDRIEWYDTDRALTCCLSTKAADLSGFDITAIALKFVGEATVDYMTYYRPVLDETLEVIKNGYQDKEYQYVSTGIMEAANYNRPENLLKSVGYCITDLSGDGIPELVIGEDFSYEEGEEPTSYIYGIYNCKYEKPSTTVEGWGRNAYRYVEGNQFVYYGSGGAMYSMYGLMHLSEDGTEIVWEDCYFTYPDGEDDIKYYYNTTGEWNPEHAEVVDLKPMGFEVIKLDHEFGKMNWTYFDTL